MLLVGLTGGIGSGKSTVAHMLEERGAVVVDADELAHRVIAPGAPGHEKVIERFGPNVLAPGGDVDRETLASIVFADPAARRDLEAIVHPEVRRMFAEEAERYRDTDKVVVLSAPLIVETGIYPLFEVLIVVSTRIDTQVQRLVRERGMLEEDVRARIAAQLPLEAEAEVADVIVDNEGTLDELEGQVDRVWEDLQARAIRSAT
jgi:dephospho-CoA kinase